MLHPTALALDYRLLHVASTGSTNQDALERARAGDRGGLWIVADHQSRGRGRVGRDWSSPVGNLYATLLLRDPSEIRVAPQLGFVAGVALAGAIEAVVGAGRGVAIKWPNDILCHGAKLAGILVEGTSTPDGHFSAALGFGVNCTTHPTGLTYLATHLGAIVAEAVSRDALLAALSASVVDALALWSRGTNFAAIRRAWLANALPQGSWLAVARPAGRQVGRFKAVDDDGRLILETDSGCMTVQAGDVFLADHIMTAAS